MTGTDEDAFSYDARKDDRVQIWHHGRAALVLAGADARKFLARVERATPDEAQRLMAKVTGQYKFGNEKEGKSRRDHKRR